MNHVAKLQDKLSIWSFSESQGKERAFSAVRVIAMSFSSPNQIFRLKKVTVNPAASDAFLTKLAKTQAELPHLAREQI